MSTTKTVAEVDALASAAHAGQFDKIGVPYIEHVRAVAAGLAELVDEPAQADEPGKCGGGDDGAGEGRGAVSAPGAGLARPLLQLTLNADDLDETEAVGHYAIRVARPLMRLVADGDDGAALTELKGLLSPAGPLGGGSSAAWHRVNEWLPAARAAARVQDIPELELLGYGRPVELWTVSMVAKFLGFTGSSANGSARKQLSRWGVESQGREPGRRGESQYSADEVRAKQAARPGRGRHGASRDGGRFAEPQDS